MPLSVLMLMSKFLPINDMELLEVNEINLDSCSPIIK